MVCIWKSNSRNLHVMLRVWKFNSSIHVKFLVVLMVWNKLCMHEPNILCMNNPMHEQSYAWTNSNACTNSLCMNNYFDESISMHENTYLCKKQHYYTWNTFSMHETIFLCMKQLFSAWNNFLIHYTIFPCMKLIIHAWNQFSMHEK